MIIAPVKTFLVDYKINNPSDNNTYYVQAVIKNSVTGATIATLNLTDNGNRYFSYPWMTPADPSGTGLQISILTTVYTDSGHTSESPIYGTVLNTYVIRDLAGSRVYGGYAPARPDKQLTKGDHKDLEDLIRKIVSEVVASIQFPEINIPKVEIPEPYDMSGIEGHLEMISEDIKSSRTADENLHLLVKESTSKLLEGFKEAEESDDKLHAIVEDALNTVKYETEETKTYVREGLANLPKGDEFLRDGARKLFGIEPQSAGSDHKQMLEKLLT